MLSVFGFVVVCLGQSKYPSIYFSLNCIEHITMVEANTLHTRWIVNGTAPQIAVNTMKFNASILGRVEIFGISKNSLWFDFVILKSNLLKRIRFGTNHLSVIKLLWSWKKKPDQYCQPINHPNDRWNLLKMQMLRHFFLEARSHPKLAATLFIFLQQSL